MLLQEYTYAALSMIFIVVTCSIESDEPEVSVEPFRKFELSWSFAVTQYIRPYTYLNDNGTMVGFTNDLIQSLCNAANQNCKISFYPTKACAFVTSIFFPGDALLNGAVDACVWWPINNERENSVAFTSAYLQELPGRWLVNQNDQSFDPKNLQSKNIGLISGWRTSQVCLETNGYKAARYTIYSRSQTALDALKSGEVHAIFSPLNNEPGFRTLENTIVCDRGAGMMLRKDSLLPTWWNPTFSNFVRCGCYRKLCAQSREKHGKSASCLLLQSGECTDTERKKYCRE